MVGRLLKGRRLWQKGSLLSPQRCRCCPVRSTYHQDMQHGDVQLSNIRAHLASPPGYKGPVNQYGGLLCSCSDRLRLMETLSADVRISNKTLGLCSGWQCSDKNMTMECCKKGHHGGFTCYPHPFKTSTAFESASINSSNALGKTSSKILVFAASSAVEYGSSFINSLPQSRRISSGLWSWRRRDPLCIGSRPFFSAGNNKTSSDCKSPSFEDSVFPVPASDVAEVNTNASLSESDEDFDFRNFPALTSSYYKDYERPSEMQVKKRVTWQTNRKLFNTDTKLTVECIPKPKGRTYDFGLGDVLSQPPPLEAGARPQGGFDTNISLDESEAAPSEAPSSSLVSAPSMPSRNLPWDTPEADNWSEISTDAQIHEESVQKPEHEFSWDPYDFDANTKSPHRLEFEESLSANVASQ